MIKVGNTRVAGDSLIGSTDEQACVLFRDMQNENSLVLKSSKFSQKGGLVEFAAGVHSLAYLEYVANAFPLAAEVTVCQVPHGASRIQHAFRQGVLNLLDPVFQFAWELWRERQMVDQ